MEIKPFRTMPSNITCWKGVFRNSSVYSLIKCLFIQPIFIEHLLGRWQKLNMIGSLLSRSSNLREINVTITECVKCSIWGAGKGHEAKFHRGGDSWARSQEQKKRVPGKKNHLKSDLGGR